MPRSNRSASADYSVGYKRPPRETRFKAGQSGNPKGRPTGSRAVGTLLRDILQQKIRVTENGRQRRLPAIEVMLRKLMNEAMGGDQHAIKLLLTLADRYAASPETKIELNELLAEDEEILARYLPASADVTAENVEPSSQKSEGGDDL